MWNKKTADLQENLNEWSPDDQMLLLAFTEDAEWLDIDSQGRVLLSKKNQQAIGLSGNEVLFIGMIDRFAVWSKTGYEKARLSSADLASRLREKMMKKDIPSHQPLPALPARSTEHAGNIHPEPEI